MPTTANTITYFVAADGTLRDGQQGSIAQTPRINYGTEYAVTLSFPPSTIAEGDQLQVALNRTRTFFSSASATGDAPVAAVAKHDVTAEEAAAQTVEVVLSTNTRAMIDQVNGIDHPVRGFFGVHVLRGQSFVTLAVADALMMSLESGPDAISPSLPVVDYPTREEAEALAERSENAAERAEEAAAGIVPPLQLDAPPTTSTSGSIGQLAVYHDSATGKDHLYHLCYITEGDSATLYHWEECVLVSQGNVSGGYPVLDENGKVLSANLPVAGITTIGAVAMGSNKYATGLQLKNNVIMIQKAANNDINTRSTSYNGAIVPSNLDYAVRSVLPNVTEIPAATSDYSLVDSSATTNNHSHVYSHTPTTAPTYRLPQVTNTAIAHYIELTIDFTNVQTYSFLDHMGEAIVPLFTPAIAAGDVYTFKMEYSNIKEAWLIYPQKQGSVADDFVMRGEVGAANGVAGLDANAKVSIDNLPLATNDVYGIISIHPSYGIDRKRPTSNTPYSLHLIAASGDGITRRAEEGAPLSRYGAITPSNLNYAVTAALTDSKHITLTDAQKATAQSVFGVGGPVVTIPAETSAYTLAEGIFTHAPTSAPTYTLPSITDDIRTHEVVLVIDFSSVQTFSFLVDGGGDVTFQSYANPTMGDVWAFRCWWYGGKWRIAPTKIKNCVTRQLTNGSLAITDAVAGDALSLKMTAPRSVVVNQLVQNGDFADGTNNWIANGMSMSVSNNKLTTTVTNDTIFSCYAGQENGSLSIIAGHTYIVHGYITASIATTHTSFGILYTTIRKSLIALTANVRTSIDVVAMADKTNSTTARFVCYLNQKESGYINGDTMTLEDVQLVDLTQYFNGDTTLIASIQTWDDLVAYDPRFASYVEYNTGTVEGVQPSVKVSGKNLLDLEHASVLTTIGGLTIDEQTLEKITCTSNSSTAFMWLDLGLYDSFVGKTISCQVVSKVNGVASSNPLIALGRMMADGGNRTVIGSNIVNFTVPSTSLENARLALRLYTPSSWQSSSDVITFENIQLELGSTATSYEPYHDGGTAQAPAPLFAVGNVADEHEAVSGVTTHKMASVDLGTLDWRTNGQRFYAPVSGIKPYSGSSTVVARLLCAKYITTAVLSPLLARIFEDDSSRVSVYDPVYTGQTAAVFTTAMSGVYLYYELATPTTSQSTPTQISLQAGSNIAMQTDGGRLASIDITYESDEL